MGRHAQPPPDCPLCDGEGKITVTTDGEEGKPKQTQTVTCSTCKGTGKA
jgi:DnaJ-class molecular chaperone